MKIITLLVAIIAVLAAVIAMQPAEFRITRTAVIPAPSAVVFEHVNTMQKWQAWSPWAKLDPNAKSTFEGPAAGVGSALHWDGNSEVGAGTMTIVESVPTERVKFRLDFLKPFKASHNAEFTFKPEGDLTTVTWSMYGTNDFIGKAMSLVMDCDKMVGTQFEQGLANLKAQVEAKPTAQPSSTEINSAS